METVGNGKDKKILVTHINIRESIFFLLLRLVFIDVLAALVVIVFFSSLFAPQISTETKIAIVSYNQVYFLVLVAIKIFATLYVVLEWLNEYYEITPHEILHRSGIMWRKEQRYQFAHIKSVGVQQGIFGRFFNYGSLSFHDWELSKDVSIYLIHNPLKYARILESILPETNKEKETIREKIQDDDIEVL